MRTRLRIVPGPRPPGPVVAPGSLPLRRASRSPARIAGPGGGKWQLGTCAHGIGLVTPSLSGPFGNATLGSGLAFTGNREPRGNAALAVTWVCREARGRRERSPGQRPGFHGNQGAARERSPGSDLGLVGSEGPSGTRLLGADLGLPEDGSRPETRSSDSSSGLPGRRSRLGTQVSSGIVVLMENALPKGRRAFSPVRDGVPPGPADAGPGSACRGLWPRLSRVHSAV